MNLEAYGEDLAYDAAFLALSLEGGRVPIEELGRLSLQLSTKLRAIAIVALLAKGDVDKFVHNLMRSARARLGYLDRVRQTGASGDHHQGAGRFEPSLDAIAAGDLETATRLHALSLSEWHRGHEYEDDYCFGRVIGVLAGGPGDAAETLERMKSATVPAHMPRWRVCQAIATVDQAAFDEAFDSLLAAREREIEANKVRGQLEEPGVVALRFVSVEGLALLRLAALRGLKTKREYRFCPSLARVAPQEPFPGR